jgi:hypothetical protein
MRRSERLRELKSVPRFPDVSPLTSAPIWSWRDRVSPMISPLRREEFQSLVSSYMGGCTKVEEARPMAAKINRLVEQEISDLEDDIADLLPHWTTTPTFYAACVGAVAAIIAAVIAFLAWRYPLPASPPELPPPASVAPPRIPLALSPTPAPTAPTKASEKPSP